MQAPFLRLIIPLATGILLQWYGRLCAETGWILLSVSASLLLLLNLRLSFFCFRYHWLNGVLLFLLLAGTGLLLSFYNNVSHRANWMNRFYNDSSIIVATISEPFTEKPKTYKTIATVQQLINHDTTYYVEGKIIIYFQKDSLPLPATYGTQIAFSRPLQPIRNTGNPGAFNYQRYASFQHIYSQVYLKKGEYLPLTQKKLPPLKMFLLTVRTWVLHTITRYIPDKKSAGLAEALLIGYKDDLDKTLVQSYSNTGVVHVIAISGLHVGIIYWLLLVIINPFQKRKTTRWLSALLVITGLWLFALLAGAGASVLRSALMFSCLAIGEVMSKKTSVFNSLAASAFLLLCYNPFWLWDAGFQLSYAAVLSIVVFMKPVYHLFNIRNPLLDRLWKLNAVTIAAQLLTLPISVYHFHQFPNYFLFTNLVAVPLSSIILIGEILLCVVAPLSAVATVIGYLLQWMINCMNHFITYMEKLPFSVWNGLQINSTQVIALYLIITALWYWLRKKNTTSFLVCLMAVLLFFCLRSYSFLQNQQQQKLIVYHVPGHQAIDFIDGTNYYCKADSGLMSDAYLQNFYLKPSRILFRLKKVDAMPMLINNGNTCLFGNKRIVLIDSSWNFKPPAQKINAHLVILSANARVTIEQVKQTFDCSQIVIDGFNPSWKVNKWRTDCEKWQLACHCVVDKGAFVMNLP
jgi:competence protein ComEC